MDNEYREFTNPEGHSWREYKLDSQIAKRIKALYLGLDGERCHSWRALAIQVTGSEDQLMGWDLVQLAQWTLGEDWEGE